MRAGNGREREGGKEMRCSFSWPSTVPPLASSHPDKDTIAAAAAAAAFFSFLRFPQ